MKTEITIKYNDLEKYLSLRRKGYNTAWSGNGLIHMVLAKKPRNQNRKKRSRGA